MLKGIRFSQAGLEAHGAGRRGPRRIGRRSLSRVLEASLAGRRRRPPENAQHGLMVNKWFQANFGMAGPGQKAGQARAAESGEIRDYRSRVNAILNDANNTPEYKLVKLTYSPPHEKMSPEKKLIWNMAVKDVMKEMERTPCKTDGDFSQRLMALVRMEDWLAGEKYSDRWKIYGLAHDMVARQAENEIKSILRFCGGFASNGEELRTLRAMKGSLGKHSTLKGNFDSAIKFAEEFSKGPSGDNARFDAKDRTAARTQPKIVKSLDDKELKKVVGARFREKAEDGCQMDSDKFFSESYDCIIGMLTRILIAKAGLTAADQAKFKDLNGREIRIYRPEKVNAFQKELDLLAVKVSAMPDDVFFHFLERLIRNDFQMDFWKVYDAFPDNSKNAHYILSLYLCEGVKSQPTMEGKVAEIKKRMDALKRNGIDYPERFTPRVLENAYLTATGKAEKLDEKGRPKKLALIVLNKSDWNGSFFLQDDSLYEGLLDKGYNLAICEAGSDGEAAERFFNYGKLEKDARSNAHFRQGKAGHAVYDLMVLGGHGAVRKVMLGDTTPWDYVFAKKTMLNIGDHGRLKEYGDWGAMFSKKGTIVLVSCSTGGKNIFSYLGRFDNVADMLSDVSRRKTIGPTESSYFRELVFDKDNFVADAKYGSGGEAVESSAYFLNKRRK